MQTTPGKPLTGASLTDEDLTNCNLTDASLVMEQLDVAITGKES